MSVGFAAKLETGQPATWEQIDECIEGGYNEVAAEKEQDLDTVHAGRWCESVTAAVERKLEEVGTSVEHVSCAGWDVINHEFFLVDIEGNRYVVDPTWQQFLDQPDPSQPKVLKARLDDLEQVIKRLGVPESKRHIWRQALAARR